MTDEAMATIGTRAIEARLALKMKHDAFSAAIGIPASTIKKLEGGHAEPSTRTLLAYAGVKINIHWLLTGEGGMMSKGVLGLVGALDLTRLETAVAEVDRAVLARNLLVDSGQRAKLLFMAYQDRIGQDALIRLIDLICEMAPAKSTASPPPITGALTQGEEILLQAWRAATPHQQEWLTSKVGATLLRVASVLGKH